MCVGGGGGGGGLCTCMCVQELDVAFIHVYVSPCTKKNVLKIYVHRWAFTLVCTCRGCGWQFFNNIKEQQLISLSLRCFWNFIIDWHHVSNLIMHLISVCTKSPIYLYDYMCIDVIIQWYAY